MPYLSEHFQRHEFACECGCGLDTVDAELVQVLELVRNRFQAPVHVDGNRCHPQNVAVGGSPTSQHLRCRAADITVDGVEPAEVADYLDSVYPNQYGLGRYDKHTHIDTREGQARWSGTSN